MAAAQESNGQAETTSDDMLVELLASGLTYEAAGTELGLSSRTVRRRMANAEFRHRVEQARGEVLQELSGLLTVGALEGATVLRELAANAKAEQVRLGAARALLEHLRGRASGIPVAEVEEIVGVLIDATIESCGEDTELAYRFRRAAQDGLGRVRPSVRL